MNEITAYTDGASSGNPGPAGWACYVNDTLYSGPIDNVTNNYAEIFAVIQACVHCPTNSRLEIVTDSKLVIGWLSLGWRINHDHIARLVKAYYDTLVSRNLIVTFRLTKGHATDKINNMVDGAASFQAQQLKKARRSQHSADLLAHGA